jgi:hypothetical protein
VTPAFPGGRAQKDAAAAAVRHAIRDGRYLAADDAPVASLAGLIVEGADLRTCERATGIPASLVALADLAVHFWLDDLPRARARATMWIDAIEPGVDLSPIPTRLALWVIDEVAANGPTPAPGLLALRDLHQRQAAGEVVPRVAWAAVRADLVAIGDHGSEQMPSAARHRLAEALAWPAGTSRTQLVECARILGELATPPMFMPEDEHRAINAAMEALFEETAAERDAAPDSYHFPDLFRARHPDMADRFEADLIRTNACYRGAVTRVSDQAEALIRDAQPVQAGGRS